MKEWYTKHNKAILIISIISLIVMNLIFICSGFFLKDRVPMLLFLSEGSLVGLANGIVIFGIIARFSHRRFITSMRCEIEELYLQGFKLWRYFDSNAIIRFEKYLGSGICYDLAALSMVLLKNYKHSRLCQGVKYDKEGKFQTRHAWTEVKIPFDGWYVLDLAWCSPCFYPKKKYYKLFNEGKESLTAEWICNYKDFWGISLSRAIREAMQNQKTSYVFKEFSCFGNPDEGYGFYDSINNIEGLAFSPSGTMMIPFYSYNNKLVSSAIIRDFVKNPKRKAPKARHIRTARCGIRRFNAWMAEHPEVQNAT